MGTNPVRLGYKASVEQFGPRELLGLAVAAESAGMDVVAVSDHFLPWRRTGGHAPHSIALLGAMAARTERITLSTSVLTPTFRHNPAVTAQAFATLAVLCPGRVVLGVGSGEALNERAAGGAGEWPAFGERFARLREAVDLMRELWSADGPVTREGGYYPVRDAEIFDRPDEPIPVFIAAGGPKTARWVGEAADGFICTSGKGRELYTDSLLPAVAEGEAAAGRAAGSVRRSIEIKLSYDRDLERAREDCRFWSPLSLTAEQKHSGGSAEELERAADALPLETITSRWIVTDDPDEAAAAIGEYVGMGFDELVLHSPAADQRRFLADFARDLMPRLRG